MPTHSLLDNGLLDLGSHESGVVQVSLEKVLQVSDFILDVKAAKNVPKTIPPRQENEK